MLYREELQLRDKESDNSWFSRLFISFGPSGASVSAGQPRLWHPPTDVYETDAHITVKMEVAGVDEEDVGVHLHGRVLTVQGRRHDPTAKLAYQQMEISYGEFRSEVYLPCEVDEAGVRADYAKGFLYILLPKAQKEHKVPIVVIKP